MIANAPARRVVVTGTGAVTPIGVGSETFWENCKAGVCGVGPIETFGTTDPDTGMKLQIEIAAEVRGFDPKPVLRALKRDKVLPHADRFSQFAGVAAAEAMEMAGMADGVPEPTRAACIIGSGGAGLVQLEKAYRDLFIERKAATHPLTLLRIIGSSPAAHVGIEYCVKGPTFGTVSACSTAAHAIGLTLQYIRSGLVDVGIAGASECVLNFGVMRAWQAMRVLSPDGCFPFSKTRNGTVLGEGAGLLVMEELDHARARGANILAEVKGFGMSSDAKDMVNPDIDGPTTAMRLALEDGGVAPDEVDYINAHGTATALNDANETRAIRKVFGSAADALSVSSTKSMHGHPLGAGGGIEAVASILAMRDGVVPPTIGLAEPDPECDLDYTPNVARERPIRHAVSNSFAFGGLNAVLVFGPPPA